MKDQHKHPQGWASKMREDHNGFGSILGRAIKGRQFCRICRCTSQSETCCAIPTVRLDHRAKPPRLSAAKRVWDAFIAKFVKEPV